MSVLTPRSSSHAPRASFTLVEMLVGMAITLVMMAAVVNLFANIGAGVKMRRATMEMSSELRMMRATLFKDLAGATCKTIPWVRPDEDQGYLEIVEGRFEDSNPTGLTLNRRISQIPGSQVIDPNGITDLSGLGDYDDILALTVQSENAPFKGRSFNFATNQVESIESNLAEIIWYAVENPADGSLGEPGMRTVYRRVLLIAPWVAPINLAAYPVQSGIPIVADDINRYYQRFDISARYDSATSRWIPNSLGDLTKRENRFAHDLLPFPHVLNQTHIRFQATPSGPLHPFGTPWETLNATRPDPDRTGEDVMLSNVLAFDLRVFDPGAPLFEYPINSRTIIEPVGTNRFAPNPNTFYSDVLTGTLSGYGAYVDLGWDDNYDYPANPNNPTVFQEAHIVGWHPIAPNNTTTRGNPAVYDTWSFHYENDGLDQDDGGTGLVDEGTNGLDDDNANGVDDILERETSPPYPVPLKGMQVKLRIYEPDTRQIREATVTRSFVP